MNKLALKAWYRLRRLVGLPVDRMEAVMQHFGAAHGDAIFIQVGANDGVALDPLRIQVERRRWRGVMVEPVPYVFERLQSRYGAHPRVQLENSAIAVTEGTLPFYHLKEAEPGESVWAFYHALGSFRRDVILKHRDVIPDIDDRLVETAVPCITFTGLGEKHDLQRVDLLQMDTEGYDWEILRHVDFTRWRPRLIVYEHSHLSEDNRKAAQNLLTEQGYAWFEHGLDTAALDVHNINKGDRRLVKFFAKQPGISGSVHLLH